MKFLVALTSAMIGAFFSPAYSQNVAAPIERQYPSLFVDHGTCGFPETQARTSFGYANFPLMGRTCWNGTQARQFVAGAGTYAAMDFRGHGGTVAGAYFSAEGLGLAGAQSFGNEIVGVYSRAVANVSVLPGHPTNALPWVVSNHAEVEINSASPGTAIVVNAELYDNTIGGSKMDKYGYILNPAPNVRGVTGLRLMDNAPAGETSYRTGIDLSGASIELAQIDGVAFCQTFNKQLQRIEFWRGCQRGSLQRTLHFVIPMNFESAINR